MSVRQKALCAFAAKHEFFIGIDSDGCVFDNMDIKHRHCFCPAFVSHFALQEIAGYACEIWEFVNLYGKTRGINRFNALLLALDLARDRQEVIACGTIIRRLPALCDWVTREPRLGNPALAAAAQKTGSSELQNVLDWSIAVNTAVSNTVQRAGPFSGVPEVIASIDGRADVVVVSQTPVDTLQREWKEHSLFPLVASIAGQEDGTKSAHLGQATSGTYASERVLMVGDAPGDLEAARSVGALFFPIVPGREVESWKELHAEGLDRFFHGAFSGDYQRQLLNRFDRALPEHPPWRRPVQHDTQVG
jgi:phosphoglycolate phosphatase-like HAD superfamily hydrolase